jgi:hypothetical protein
VRLDVFGETPSFIMYRDGKGSWTVPQEVEPDVFELHITNAYEVVAVCGSLTSFDASLLRRTFSDGATAFVVCISNLSFAPVLELVTGRMEQAGEVFLYDYDRSVSGPWDFQVQVPPGTHDLIAVGATGITIRRDLAITEPGTLPTIDLAQEGAALATTAFSVNSLDGESVSSSIFLETANSFAIIDGTGSQLRGPPSSLLLPTDRRDAWIDVNAPKTHRSISTTYTGIQSVFQLLPFVEGVTFSYPDRTLTASFTELPPFDEIALSFFDYGAGHQRVEVTKSWLEANQRSYIAFDDVPNEYDRRLVCDLSRPYSRDVTIYELGEQTFRSSGIVDHLNGAVARTVDSRRQQVRQLVERARAGRTSLARQLLRAGLVDARN